jgi:DNA-binding GntR family transcriptional regulator
MSKAIHRDDVDEHEGIMRAALARDVAQTLKLNRAHIERTTEKVLKSLEPVQFTPRGQSGNEKSVKRTARV